MVHVRNTAQFYRLQYPALVPKYALTEFNDLVANTSLSMPVVKYPRKGRPRRSRFISKREIAITRHKRKFREKAALQSEIVSIY